MNIANLLKYCPKGTKLYSPIWGEVEFIEVVSSNNIIIKSPDDNEVLFYCNGAYHRNGECVLFPSKDQRDWSKFRLPLKRGDIMMKADGTIPFIANGEFYKDTSPKYICGIDSIEQFSTGIYGWTTQFYIPASEEAKKELFNKMAEAGYKWNVDTLELEKIEPTFKEDYQYDKKQHKLVKQEFKPFDKVLVRNKDTDTWKADIYLGYDEEEKYCRYKCTRMNYQFCIPYEGNEYLLGTTDNN